MDNENLPVRTRRKKETTLEFFNGFGGFAENGTEYEIVLEGSQKPPAPWINVISNGKFGFHISESGAGFTWAYNSRENKLTPWSNDPVCDKPSEAIYIRDDVSGKIMTPVSMGREDRGRYRVRHGFGYTTFYHEEENIGQELRVFTPLEEPLKIWELKLTNGSDHERYLTLTYYVEWVLGVDRDQTSPYILTSYNNEYEYLSAKSIYNYDYRKHHAFIFSSEMIAGYTGDRQEFLGTKGSVWNPQKLEGKLSCNTGACYDSCGVIQVSVAVPPGESKTVLFGLGESDDFEEIEELRKKYRDASMALAERKKVRMYWEDLLGGIRVETHDRAMDILVNGWLLYQTVSCRINARAAFYQCGGAYGFRDQLQDGLALLYSKPEILRSQIITAASRQFEEGDVQHWWHPPTGVGVRTKITDDLLWLPYTTAAYIKCTGDYSILSARVPYIRGQALENGHHEMMLVPEVSELEGSIYEHCKKTILRTHFGKHGLPLMGGGDWNDGMNRVGIEGTGESVWMGWFYYSVLSEFIPLCYHQDDVDFASELEKTRNALQSSLEEEAWDGEWYLRAFYDDDTKLGSKENDECKIDSISQSWSVISKAARKDRALSAVQSAWCYLVKEEDGLSLLLAPPFNKTSKNPGYIKNYYPGVRENGGQYTHAAVWLAISAAMAEEYKMAYTLFTMLNPIQITSKRKDALKYEKEPYVITADISLSAPYSGRGGWSWYTGSAGWMYQGLVKWFLGIRKEGEYLVIDPASPAIFGDYKVYFRYGNSEYEIKIERAADGRLAEMELTVDGIRTEGNKIKLENDDRVHQANAIF
jgi:cellobiose phosphorylase